ncbi:MAG: DUF433 domain-containing protein [Acidobacteria bacterium]|nr:DUF433 domain-containing protein [Acidobacteriota bacterium]
MSTILNIANTAFVPLTQWEDGTVRLKGTRLPLSSIIYHFNLGSTPEQIAHIFEGVNLADIYGAIWYYLNNKPEVDAYIAEQEKIETTLRERDEADADYQRSTALLRERLLARRDALRRDKAS